jgi:hypothetical protein
MSSRRIGVNIMHERPGTACRAWSLMQNIDTSKKA